MIANRSSSTLAVLLTLSTACGAGSQAGGPGTMLVREDQTGLVVTREGEAERPPDLATFTIGVEARRPTVAEARELAAQAQQRVLEALRQAGITAGDVQTAQLSIAPDVQYTEGTSRVVGTIVSNQVRVRLRALDRLSDAIDGAVRAGGELARLEGIAFEVADPDALRVVAREKAIERARRDAEQLARLLGVSLGSPISVEEIAMGSGGPQPMMMREVAQSDTRTPVVGGSVRIQVQVRVRWSIH